MLPAQKRCTLSRNIPNAYLCKTLIFDPRLSLWATMINTRRLMQFLLLRLLFLLDSGALAGEGPVSFEQDFFLALSFRHFVNF